MYMYCILSLCSLSIAETESSRFMYSPVVIVSVGSKGIEDFGRKMERKSCRPLVFFLMTVPSISGLSETLEFMRMSSGGKLRVVLFA